MGIKKEPKSKSDQLHYRLLRQLWLNGDASWVECWETSMRVLGVKHFNSPPTAAEMTRLMVRLDLPCGKIDKFFPPCRQDLPERVGGYGVHERSDADQPGNIHSYKMEVMRMLLNEKREDLLPFKTSIS